MKYCIFLLTVFFTLSLNAQSTYQTEEGEIHLLGNIDLEDLEKEPYLEWYSDTSMKSYKLFDPSVLEDVEVRIFMGTWCGDTQQWLPEFIKLWKENELSEDQLTITALNHLGDHYKRSPDGEEEVFQIHRVPTFIFFRDEIEIGRIVESPMNDLKTDMNQIAAGIPSRPRYRGASTFFKILEKQHIDSLLLPKTYENVRNEIKHDVAGFSELNTLGYVLKARGQHKQAEFAFRMNKDLFPYEPNTWFSLGKMYYDQGLYKESKEYLMHVLELKPDSENTKKMLQKVRERT